MMADLESATWNNLDSSGMEKEVRLTDQLPNDFIKKINQWE